jgi:hypothetical protein
MAKLTGPLMSNTASGTLGPRLTFSQRKSGQQVRFQKKQKDVITDLRTAQREKFTTSTGWWNLLTLSEKKEWYDLGNTF